MPKLYSAEERDYRRKMQRLHALAHYLHESGELTWREEPQQGVRRLESDKRTITIEVDGPRWDAVYAALAQERRW